MEILRIDICNLNSLKGEFSIDFMSSPLRDQDIFAITGVTGSGKSTILDAITLALYNRIPRLDGKKGSKSNPNSKDPYKRLAPADTENSLSRGTKEGYAKVLFEVSGERYRAEWVCVLKNVNFDGSHSLYHITHENGEEKAASLVSRNLINEFDQYGVPKDKTVSKAVVELIGLGYDQFCKACILAQNSFASFLKADDSEKAGILEKITGTSIYGRIADAIVAGHEGAVTEMKTIDSKICGQRKLTIEDPDELARATAERDGLRQQQEELTQEIEALEKGLAWWKTLTDLEKEKGEAEKKKKDAEQKEQELLPQQKRLERHDKVDVGLKRLDDETDAKQHLAFAEESVKEAEERLDDNRKKIGEQEEKKVEAENEAERRKAGLEKLAPSKPIKENIALIRAEYGMLDRAVNKLRKEADRFAPQNGYGKLEEGELIEAVAHLARDLAPELTRETVQDRLIVIGRELDLCDDADKLYPQMNRVRELDAEDAKDQETLRIKKEPLDHLGEEIEQLTKLISTLESKDLTLKRSQLQEGTPCPLCGAEHHPYTAEATFNELVENEKKQLEGKKAEKDNIERLIRQAQGAIDKREGERRVLKKGIDDLKRKMMMAAPSFEEIFSKYKDEEIIKVLRAKAEEASRRAEEKAEAENTLSLIGLRDLLEEAGLHRKELDKHLPEGWYSKRTADRNGYAQALEKTAQEYGHAEKAVSDADIVVKRIVSAIETLKKLTPELENDREAKKEDRSRKKEFLKEQEDLLTAWIDTFNAGDETPVSREELAREKEDNTDWNRLRKSINEAENVRVRWATLFEQANQDLQEHQEKEDRPSETKEELEKRKADASFALNEPENGVKHRLEVVSGRLATHEAAMKEIESYLPALKAAQKKVDLWARFYNMLGERGGSKDAKEFRKLAQNYTLGLLLSYANEELSKFTRRYTLKKQNDSSLEIMVLDGELGERFTSSLSGGETFMVSLALALGLSSISSGSVTLKNIFIDEGFGSLDGDMQKTVVGALNTLRTQGKRVGLISHTSALLGDDGIYKIAVEKVDDKFSRIVME